VDLTQLANLGEFIGGVAVLVTLVYLAVQVRQNTRTVAAASSQAVTSTSADILMRGAANKDLAQVFLKMISAPDSLDAVERIQAWMYLRAAFRTMENQYYQSRRGLLDESWPGYLQTLGILIRTPYIREWWRGDRTTFGPLFRELVDEHVSSSEANAREIAEHSRLSVNIGEDPGT
jgi:hypothetical protein